MSIVVRFRLILSIGLWACALLASATHILGGTMYYEYLGGVQYRITLELYRDCGPNNTLGIPFDDPVQLAIYDGNGNLQFDQAIPFDGESLMPVTLTDPCLTLPPYVCESVAYYSTIVDLQPNATGYHISYQRCCRTPGIINLMVPEDQGFTCTVFIPVGSQQVNNSPKFNVLPPVALCIGQLLELDMSAIDPDGDQMTYALWTPFHGGSVNDPIPLAAPPPYQSVIWSNGYGAAQPIDSDPLLSLDPVTGILSIRPTAIGSYALGIAVSEYRNGQFMGVIHRDVHMNVVACETMVPASIRPQEELCSGLTITPSNEATFGQLWSWDFGDPTTSADTSSQEFPVWTYSAPGIYQVTLITNAGFPCADTATALFDMRPPLDVGFTGASILCPMEEVTLFATGNISSNATLIWDVEQIGEFLGTSATFSFPAHGDHLVKLTVHDQGCENEYQSSILVQPFPRADLICDTRACAGEPISFMSTSEAAAPLIHYWDLGDGNSATEAAFGHSYQEPGTYTISLTVATTSGCIAEDTIILPDHLVIDPKPLAGYTLDRSELNIFDAELRVSDASLGANSWQYDVSGVTYSIPSFTHPFNESGIHWIRQIVGNEFQCSDTLILSVMVSGHLFFAPNAFTPGTDGINDGFAPVVMGALSCEWMIHDRWGIELFRTSDRDRKWNGEELPQDIYIYTVQLVDQDRMPHVYRGHITLLR